jgi:hypothetical protein
MGKRPLLAQSGRLFRNRASDLVTDEDQVGNCLRGVERELGEVQGLYSGRLFLVTHGLRSLQTLLQTAPPITGRSRRPQEEVFLLIKKIPRSLSADGGSKVDAVQGYCGAAG